MIETQTGISVEEQSLVYLGKVLDDGLTLNDYDVRSHSHTIDVHSKGDSSKTCKIIHSIFIHVY